MTYMESKKIQKRKFETKTIPLSIKTWYVKI